MQPEVDLSVIIVNWNTQELLRNCLNSVLRHVHNVSKEIIVVDNGSSDGSQEMVKREFAEVNLIETGENLGFSKGNNVGLLQAKGRYLLLLNSDTLMENDALSGLVNWMDMHLRVGICGPKLLNKDGSTQPSSGYLPGLWSIGLNMCLPVHAIPGVNKFTPALRVIYPEYYEKEHETGYVSGACFMIRRETYEQLGGLDENIFMYVEEVEMCKRAWDEEWEVWLVPQFEVKHLERGSSVSGKKGAILGVYKNLYYYFRKHEPDWKLWALEMLLTFGAVIRLPRAWNVYWEALKIRP